MVNSIDKVKKEKIIRQFGNEFFTRFEADHYNMVLIEEAIEPGLTLKAEETLMLE